MTAAQEHAEAFAELLQEFPSTWYYGTNSFAAIQSDSMESLEPVLEGDFHNSTAPILALKSAFATFGIPPVGATLSNPDGIEFRVKGFRTSQDDVTVQIDLTDIHDKG